MDQSITPPSYGIKMGDIIRETESPRLRHRAARDFEPPKWLQFSGGQEPAAQAAAPQQLPSRLGPGVLSAAENHSLGETAKPVEQPVTCLCDVPSSPPQLCQTLLDSAASPLFSSR